MILCHDPTLVNTFFGVFFARLREKFWATHYVADVLKKYHWSDIGPVVLAALTENDDDTRVKAHPEYFMDLEVLIAKELSRGEAQLALVKLAVEKTEKLEDAVLSSPACLDEFWKLVVDCGEENVFVALFDRFKLIKPRLLGKTASIFSKLLNQVDLVDVKKAGMENIIDCRLKWLASQIRVLEKPFTWEMPAAEFPDNAQIETFLKSSDESMSTKGVVTFETDYGARDFASKYTYKRAPRHKNASFDMKASTDGTFVTISKTRGWYDEFLPGLPYLKKELQNLRDPTSDYIPIIN
ncbi:hypothetical protein PHMEG_00026592 [Phytophthora megakarya]|uniref:Uncharacterized protein n=1 Tax=Phytophthora megakarya TaxID=4795 RepID=A0A225VAG2_9STRA|nr:hypothetical protein PHMEG_00026592 [Phytophthora megakarya]